jgi:enamine deaminase RidA (YjgF/YER057c/UK114 family)
MEIEKKLEELGLSPFASPAKPNRAGALQVGNLVFLSGKTPVYPDGRRMTGKVGTDLDTAEAYQGARQTMVNLLGELKETIGDLDRVKGIVKVFCMVNAAPDFGEPSQVADGASDLLLELYGDRGKHARTAIGVASIVAGLCFEADMIVEVG